MTKDIGQIDLEGLADKNRTIPLSEQSAKYAEVIVSGQLKKAIDLIETNKNLFNELVDELVKKNRLSEEDLAKILD